MRDIHSRCTLASNIFTLLAGSYYFEILASGYSVDAHQAILRNTTDALIGAGDFAWSGSFGSGHSHIAGVITLAAPMALPVEHEYVITLATHGYGRFTSLKRVALNMIQDSKISLNVIQLHL